MLVIHPWHFTWWSHCFAESESEVRCVLLLAICFWMRLWHAALLHTPDALLSSYSPHAIRGGIKISVPRSFHGGWKVCRRSARAWYACLLCTTFLQNVKVRSLTVLPKKRNKTKKRKKITNYFRIWKLFRTCFSYESVFPERYEFVCLPSKIRVLGICY